MSRDARRIQRRFFAHSESAELDSAGRVRLCGQLIEHAGLEGRCVVTGMGDRLEIWSPTPGPPRTRRTRSRRRELTERLAQAQRLRTPAREPAAEMVTLTYMPTEHVPVLAAELIRFAAPEPGETVVDCTFGGGGHSRLIAERLGAEGTLIGDRPRPRRRRALRVVRARGRLRDPLHPRRLRRRARHASRPRASSRDLVLFDFGVSSMQIDAWERGFSYSFDAPLDMRMDPDAELDARDDRQRVARGADRRDPPQLRRRAARALDRPPDRRPPPARDDLRAGRGGPRRPAAEGALRPRQPRQAHLPGDPDRRQRRARGDRRRPARRLGPARSRRPPRRDLLPLARGPARQALPRRPRPRLHLPAGVPRLPLRPRARGRAAHQGGVAPSAGEVADNPRSVLGPPARRPQARRNRSERQARLGAPAASRPRPRPTRARLAPAAKARPAAKPRTRRPAPAAARASRRRRRAGRTAGRRRHRRQRPRPLA